MEKSKVIIIPIDNYDEENVYKAMQQGINLLGGIKEFVKPDEKILVKPNFLLAAPPEKASTTHPSVIKGMLRILQENGCTDVAFGDSPGHGSCAGAAGKLDMTNPENQFGATLTSMDEEVLVPFPEGTTAKEFYFTREIAEADAIINLCKMKTHALERVTGAVKNVYGFVCGHRKAAGHVSFPNATIFARMLCDIHKCRTPRIHIMDGIMAMEGNGPSAGTPIPMNVMLFSTDPVALDSVFCNLVYLDSSLVPTCTQGEITGLGKRLEKDIIIETPEGILSFEDAREKFGNADFDVDRNGSRNSMLGTFSKIMTSLSRRPYIDKKLCIKCGICVSHCPVPGKAVDFKNEAKDCPPEYDYKKCIRCYCCQEMCPQKAIKVKGKI